jgi:pimeloyl-ACP methyl ester carboxylesterase
MDVVLVHGLWMPGVIMSPLALRLARAGYRTHLFHYRSHARRLEANVERLAAFSAERLAGRPAHYVAHSLGGLVVLGALSEHAELAVGAAVLLGTPAQGCQSARIIGSRAFGRWMLGQSAPQWREGASVCWTRREPLGVVAGTVPLGLARTMVRLQGPNDGVTRLEETYVEGMLDRVVLPVAHSAMVVSPRVAAQVVNFLEHGRFAR